MDLSEAVAKMPRVQTVPEDLHVPAHLDSREIRTLNASMWMSAEPEPASVELELNV